MTSSVLEVALEKAEPVFELTQSRSVGKDELAELGVEAILSWWVVDEEGQEGVQAVIGGDILIVLKKLQPDK